MEINVLGVAQVEMTDEIFEKYLDFINKGVHYGAIGGRFSLEITPTSVGKIYIIKDNLDKTELNITDFGSW